MALHRSYHQVLQNYLSLGTCTFLLALSHLTAFAPLARKCAPVMLLQLGEVRAVVISSPEAAKEVMKTHDSIFFERPHMYAVQSITYNFQDIAFARGDRRTEIRKICLQKLFSQKRVQSFSPIREEEMANLVRTIASNVGLAVNLKELLYSSTLTILSRAVFGRKCKQEDAFKKLIPDVTELFGGLSIVNLYPSVKLFHLTNAMRPKHTRLHQEVDEILENIIQEHRATKLTKIARESEVDDLVHVLLDIQDHGNLEVPLSTSSIKAIILVSNHFMVYYIPCAQLLIVIPRGFLIVQWTLEEQTFEFFPFGAGRRICPGISYGIASVELILANLLYHFDWKLPNGMKPIDLDMTEVFGATLRRKEDLCLIPIPHHVVT